MIEFKADCGHTVRAKDDDAGGVVRCSYCGRNAAVPDARDEDLDFLFRDFEQSAERAEATRAKRPRRHRFFSRKRPRRPHGFDPFSLILRMCYAALLISIVIVVGQKYVLPLLREGLSGRLTRHAEETPVQAQPRKTRTQERGPGLIGVAPLGLYISSTPPDAWVYVIEAAQAPLTGRIARAPGCKQLRANGDPIRLPDGTYVVEVVLPWNDPDLNDPSLPYYENYRAFRRAIENAGDDVRARLVEQFFLPDEAWPVFVDQTEEQIFLVRQYRDVEVRNGRSQGVRALFLPKIKPGGRGTFSIAQVVTHYLPSRKAYNFDEEYVRNELRYYEVPEPDQLFVIEGLARIGVMPYVTPDGRTRLFKIGIHDGIFAAKVIRESGG